MYSGSHIEDASNNGSDLENEERNKANGSKSSGESSPSIHVSGRRNGSEKELPGHGGVGNEGRIFFDSNSLLKLLSVGEIGRFIQELLKGSIVGLNLGILLLRADLNDAVVLLNKFSLFVIFSMVVTHGG